MDLVCFGCRFLVINPNDVVLSVCIGVGGCGWPISINIVLAGMDEQEFTKRAPISAPTVEVMTFL